MGDKLYGRLRVSCDFLDMQPGDQLLSIGCKDAELEAQIFGRVACLTAIDINQAQLVENQKRVPAVRFEYGDIVAGTKYEAESFDKILFLEVIEHLPPGTEEQAIQEIYRLLKRDGILVLSTPNDRLLTRLFDPAYWLINHRHYKIEYLRQLVTGNGFMLEHEFIGGGFIELFWIPLFYLLLRLRLAQAARRVMDKILDLEYRRGGFQTIILKCRKRGPD